MPYREDFAQRAVEEWPDVLPGLALGTDELASAVRLSRLAMLQDSLDERALRDYESEGIAGVVFFRLLALLRRTGDDGLTNAELVERLGGSKAGMSNRLTRLDKAGVIERIPSLVDRRSHANALSNSGKDLADRVVSAVVSSRHQMFAPLTEQQMSAFSATLAEIIYHLDPNG